MATKEATNITVEETSQENSKSRGFFGFFSRKEEKVEPVSEIKIEQTETKTEQPEEVKTEQINEVKPETENTTIKVEPAAAPSTSKPIRINEINLYDEEPSLRDIPLDIYDDSIQLEPQNLKYTKYQSIENTDIDSKLNNVNLYESTPEMKKTIFRKIKEIFKEIIRLIKVGLHAIYSFLKACINAIFAFIWLIIGGTVTAIFVFFRKMCFSILRSFIKFMFTSSKKTDQKKGFVEGISDVKENIDNLWDINKMLVTSPVYQSV